MSNSALALDRVHERSRLVLEGFLRTTIADAGEALAGVSDRLDALRVRVGIDPDDLPPEKQFDTLPQVDVFATGADSNFDVLEATDTEITLTVAATVQFDGGDYRSAARSAVILALHAADVLEAHLPDPTGTSTLPIYDCRNVRPVAEAAVLVDDDRPNTVRARAELTAYQRSAYTYEPVYANPDRLPSSGVIYPDAAATLELDTGTITSASANRATAPTVSAATLAGATTASLDVSAVTSWPDSSGWTVWLGRHNASVSGTLAGGQPSVTLATYGIATGDRWVVTVEHGTSQRVLTWIITWTVQ